MLIKTIAYCFFCICAGSAVSAGFVAFITMLGIFDKLAEQMKSGKGVHRIEALIIAGVTIGNAAYLFGLRIPIGLAGFSIFNLFGGIFIGCLAGALAETLQVMPILSRRLGVRTWLPYVIAAAAIGKALGCAWQILFFPSLIIAKGVISMKVKQNDQEYNRYVEAITPKHSCFKNCLHAFLVGGCICLLGQVIFNVCTTQFHYEEADAMSVCSILLVFLSVLLTGLNLYKPLAKYGGAGALVPITGFANSVAAPTIEYKKEGEVFGKGVKVFTIAGPVILFGVVVSFVAGFIYWIFKLL